MHQLCHTENWMNLDLKLIQDENDIKRLTSDKCAINLENLPLGKLTKSITQLLPKQSLKLLKISGKVLNIEEEGVSSMKYLKHLNLSDVDLEDSEVFNGSGGFTKNLEVLDLSSNKLSNVTFLKTESTKIKRVILDKNKLQTVPRELKSFDNVQELSMNNNKIRHFDVQNTMINVEYLDISHNLISNLSGLEHFPNVVVLNLTNNIINDIRNKYFENDRNDLRELLLDHNLIEILPVRILLHFPNLIKWSMEDNKLRKLIPTTDNYQNTKLEYLNLAKNSLDEIPYNYLKWFPSLKIFKMNNNKLTYLRTSTFANLNNLYELDLSNNAFVNFNVKRLVPLESLSILDISNNNIETLDYSSLIYYNQNLKTIGLNGNSLNCVILVEMLNSFQANNISVDGGHCENKEHIKGICCKDTDGNNTDTELRLKSLILMKEMEHAKLLEKMNEKILRVHKDVLEKNGITEDSNEDVTKAVFFTGLGIVVLVLLLILAAVIAPSFVRKKGLIPVHI